MSPGIPATHGAAPAPRAGSDADTNDKSGDAPDQASELDYFLQLLLGLAPPAQSPTAAGATVKVTSGDDGLPPDGKKLPPAPDDGAQALLKFAAALPLNQLLALSSGAAKGDRALTGRAESALRQLAGEQKSIAAVLKQLVQSQAAAVEPANSGSSSAPAAPVANAAQPAGTAQAPAATPAPRAVSVPAIPVRSPDFGAALGSRVQWMARNDLQFARIDLSPAHLGPLEIHIHLDGDKAQVTFGAHHAVTRDALEAAVPRLRGLLGDSGLQLVQVNVGQQGMTGRDRRPFAQASGDAVAATGGTEAVELGVMPSLHTGLREGLVDDYA